jgi:hypothetical protein
MMTSNLSQESKFLARWHRICRRSWSSWRDPNGSAAVLDEGWWSRWTRGSSARRPHGRRQLTRF